MNQKAICGIDLFAGAGGLSLGAELAGVKVTHAIENHPAMAATYRYNHPETTVLENDIRAVKPFRGQSRRPLILFGGPPCQGFSTSNQKTRTLDNPQNWLFGEFFRFARAIKPDWIVLENVTGLHGTAKGHFVRLIESEFEALDYAFVLWTMCAVDFGVPQRRSRLFFVGRRRGQIPTPPSPHTKNPITVRQAIFDLPKLKVGSKINELEYRNGPSSTYAREMRQRLKRCTGHLVSTNNDLVVKRYQHIPQGGNWCDIPARLMQNYSNLEDNRSRHTGIYHRLCWDEPSVVIANYRKNMLVHPEQDRGLSVREAARLQSFPDRYRFCGSIGFQQQQVGNAVPPKLAKVVFDRIIESM